MSAAVKTSVTELPESRVRVEAEVPPEEIERRMQATARQLGQNLRMPGFRKGKVPPPVVIQRIGRESVLDETVRGAMGRWYLDAIDAAGIHPVGDPELDVGDLPGEGQPLTFTIEIGVRPTATLGEYKGVEVGKREPAADDEAVDAELEALRERSARLETAEGAAADKGDFVVIDYVGSIDGENFEGGEGRDQLVELGSGRLVPASRTSSWARRPATSARSPSTSPTTTARPSWPARRPSSRSRSRRSSARTSRRSTTTSPPTRPASTPSPSCARTSRPSCARPTRRASRPSSARRCSTPSSRLEGRRAGDLVDARAQEMWDRMLHSLSHQGIARRPTCGSPGREEEIIEEAKPDAEQALRREAVLAAVVEAEGIEASDGDILDALQTTAARERTTPEKLRARPREGRAPGRPARGPRAAQGDRPAGRERDADIRRAGPGARQALDTGPTRQRRRAVTLWTPGARD